MVAIQYARFARSGQVPVRASLGYPQPAVPALCGRQKLCRSTWPPGRR